MYTAIVQPTIRFDEAISQFHPYEGHPMSTVVYPIRLLKELGVENLISTCRARRASRYQLTDCQSRMHLVG